MWENRGLVTYVKTNASNIFIISISSWFRDGKLSKLPLPRFCRASCSNSTQSRRHFQNMPPVLSLDGPGKEPQKRRYQFAYLIQPFFP